MGYETDKMSWSYWSNSNQETGLWPQIGYVEMDSFIIYLNNFGVHILQTMYPINKPMMLGRNILLKM